MDNIKIAALDTADIDTLIALARRIWHAHYPGIIDVEQIDYMLERGYNRQVILGEIEQGVIWLSIWDGTAMIGFISVGPYGEKTMKLHKLYVLPDYHGQGIGARALAEVERIARSSGTDRLVLNVNKHNEKAIRSYGRACWKIVEEVVVDIGNGFKMDDYVMAKDI